MRVKNRYHLTVNSDYKACLSVTRELTMMSFQTYPS